MYEYHFFCFFCFRSPWLHYNFIYYLTANGRQFKKDCDFVHKVTEEIIESRKYVLVSCFLQILINGSLLGIFSLIMFPYLKLVSSVPTRCRMYSIRYNILSLTDFQHICDFLINNTGSHSITEIL